MSHFNCSPLEALRRSCEDEPSPRFSHPAPAPQPVRVSLEEVEDVVDCIIRSSGGGGGRRALTFWLKAHGVEVENKEGE